MNIVGNLGYKINRYLSPNLDKNNVTVVDHCSDPEYFKVNKMDDGLFTFITNYGKRLSAQEDGGLESNRGWDYDWEKFQVNVISISNINEYRRKTGSCFLSLLPNIDTNSNDKLETINHYNEPSNGGQDKFQCIQHDASIQSGQNIKTCLKCLSEYDRLECAMISAFLEKYYQYSVFVWEDKHLYNRQINVGGIKGAISTWVIMDDGNEIVERIQILIVYEQKENMNTGIPASINSEKDVEDCIDYLMANAEIDTTSIAGRLEEEYNYSSFVYEDLKLDKFDLYTEGLIFGDPLVMHTYCIKEKSGGRVTLRFNIIPIYGQKQNIKTEAQI